MATEVESYWMKHNEKLYAPPTLIQAIQDLDGTSLIDILNGIKRSIVGYTFEKVDDDLVIDGTDGYHKEIPIGGSSSIIPNPDVPLEGELLTKILINGDLYSIDVEVTRQKIIDALGFNITYDEETDTVTFS